MAEEKYDNRNPYSRNPQMRSFVDPYLYQRLNQLLNRKLVVQTVKDSVRGTLNQVYPDHITVTTDGNHFFVRTAQIVWVKPD